MTAAAGCAAATEAGQRVLTAAVMRRLTHMSTAVAGLVGAKVIEACGAARGERTMVAVMRVEAIVYVAVKAMRAVEPGTGSEEDAADKPVGTIVAVGSAVVGSVVKVAVGTNGRSADIDTDGYLRVVGGYPAQQCDAKNGERKDFQT